MLLICNDYTFKILKELINYLLIYNLIIYYIFILIVFICYLCLSGRKNNFIKEQFPKIKWLQ